MSQSVVVLDSRRNVTEEKYIEIFENGITIKTNEGNKIIESFLKKHNTENTKRAYRNSILEFFKFMYKEEMLPHLTFNMMIVNPSHALAYEEFLLNQLKEKKIKIATFNSRVRGIKQFYDWLIYHTTSNTTNEKIFNVNPFAKIKQRVENDSEGSEPLTLDEVELMLNNPYTKNKHLQERDLLILEMAISTGIRNTALITITEDNFYERDGNYILKVEDKGGKVAHMSINKYYDRLMKWYSIDKKLRTDDNGTIFNLHPHSANRIIREWAKSVGIKKKITFHSLRTTTACEVVRMSGGNLFKAQEVLHHADVKVTHRYVDKAKKIIYDAEHVLDGVDMIKKFDETIQEMSKDELVDLLLSLSKDIKTDIIRKIRGE